MRAKVDLLRNLKSGAIVLSVLFAVTQSAEAAGECGFSRGDQKAGEETYNETCIACHGEDGKGTVPGAPDFNKKGGGVLSKNHHVLAKHIKNGFQAPGAPMAMPAKGGNPSLTDTDIESVHTYLHQQFGCG